MNKMSSAIIAMSGGVDSSVAAAICKEKYRKVIGCTLKLFEAESTDIAINDAAEVCKKLGIDHIVVDSKDIFKKYVIDYFINSYKHGETPSPCVMCNPNVKFFMLEKIRKDIGFCKMVTGHYAILENRDDLVYLKKAKDQMKDQSYFLYRIPNDILRNAEFPLGEFQSKLEVRRIAESLGLETSCKKDSQDICFIKNCKYTELINSAIQGNIIDELDGKILAKHNGIENYTIGQRKGLGLSGGPFYVKKIDADTNSVIVSKELDYKNTIFLDDVVWVNNEILGACSTKLRSSKPQRNAIINKTQDGNYFVTLNEADIGVAPGQHCVFYDNEYVIGGGVIKDSIMV